jgi:esterase/lipase
MVTTGDLRIFTCTIGRWTYRNGPLIDGVDGITGKKDLAVAILGLSMPGVIAVVITNSRSVRYQGNACKQLAPPDTPQVIYYRRHHQQLSG